jgi:hypothetical protein
MRFASYVTFLKEASSFDNRDAEAVLKIAKADIEKMGYKIISEDKNYATRHTGSTSKIEFDGDGGVWAFECFNSESPDREDRIGGLECYLSYPAGANKDFSSVMIYPEELIPILEKVKKDSVPLHAIAEFVAMLGFDPDHVIIREIRKKLSKSASAFKSRAVLITSKLIFNKDVNGHLSDCKMYARADLDYDLIVRGEFYSSTFRTTKETFTDFQTDNFLLKLMELLNVENTLIESIIKRTHDKPIGTCFPVLKKELRGNFAGKKFGFT